MERSPRTWLAWRMVADNSRGLSILKQYIDENAMWLGEFAQRDGKGIAQDYLVEFDGPVIGKPAAVSRMQHAIDYSGIVVREGVTATALSEKVDEMCSYIVNAHQMLRGTSTMYSFRVTPPIQLFCAYRHVYTGEEDVTKQPGTLARCTGSSRSSSRRITRCSWERRDPRSQAGRFKPPPVIARARRASTQTNTTR